MGVPIAMKRIPNENVETEADLDRMIEEQRKKLPVWWHDSEERQQKRDMRPIRDWRRVCDRGDA